MQATYTSMLLYGSRDLLHRREYEPSPVSYALGNMKLQIQMPDGLVEVDLDARKQAASGPYSQRFQDWGLNFPWVFDYKVHSHLPFISFHATRQRRRFHKEQPGSADPK
jgi:hypothetical protein